MNLYGLIGYPLSHSFSKKYFTEKFQREGINDSKYELFEIKEASQILEVLKNNPSLKGLNVTIPHKEEIMKHINVDVQALKIGAVNVIKIQDDQLVGYNSDFYGFERSFNEFGKDENDFIYKAITQNYKALVLGDGGAAKAVKAVMEKNRIDYKLVSRRASDDSLLYSSLTKELLYEYNIVINTTPLGMYPNVELCPDIPYQFLSSHNYLFDLVYNPPVTEFMQRGRDKGAIVKNGYDMLIYQAEKAWEIWTTNE